MLSFRHSLFMCAVFFSASLYSQFSQVGEIWYACDGFNGGVQIEILEGVEDDYYFVWPHDGKESLYHDNLPPGEYLFYIENRFGCKEELTIVIDLIPSCTVKASYSFNQKTCLYEATVDFGVPGFPGIDLSSIVVEWNYQGLTGQAIEFEFPEGQNQFKLCFSYTLNNVIGGTCCSGDECITVVRDPGEEFCHDTAPCRLVINEVVRDGDRSFVEFLVVGTGKEPCLEGCNLVGSTIDDNNGSLIKDPYPLNTTLSGGIDKGYIKLSDAPSWEKVPIGSRIVIFKDTKNLEWEEDPTDANGDGEYYVWVKNTNFIHGFTTSFSSELETYQYNGFPVTPKWSHVEYDLGYEGLQTRVAQSDQSHAIATGGAQISELHGEGVVPLAYSFSPQNEISIRLMNDAYNLSGSYSVTTGTGSYTPGQGNSTQNLQFVSRLLGCKDDYKSLSREEPTFSSVLGSITAAPNPFNDEISVTIIFPSGTPFVLRVMDLAGVVLRKVYIDEYDVKATVNLGPVLKDYPAGTYLLSAIDATGQQLSTKAIKIQ